MERNDLWLNVKDSYRILPNTRASPQIEAPPQFLDHIPEVSRPDLRVNAVY